MSWKPKKKFFSTKRVNKSCFEFGKTGNIVKYNLSRLWGEHCDWHRQSDECIQRDRGIEERDKFF